MNLAQSGLWNTLNWRKMNRTNKKKTTIQQRNNTKSKQINKRPTRIHAHADDSTLQLGSMDMGYVCVRYRCEMEKAHVPMFSTASTIVAFHYVWVSIGWVCVYQPLWCAFFRSGRRFFVIEWFEWQHCRRSCGFYGLVFKMFEVFNFFVTKFNFFFIFSTDFFFQKKY